MFKRTTLLGILALTAFVNWSLRVQAADSTSAKASAEKALIALKDGVYESFTAEASPMFTKGFPVGVFKAMSQDLSPRLKSGYEITYLGTLNFNGADMYLFKVGMKDKGSDLLTKVVLDRNAKIDGFTID